MSITSYRPALLKGERPQPVDPMLRDPTAVQAMGASSIEDYVCLDVIEPAKGRTNFAPHIANASACGRLKLGYAIYPWVHFYPEWVEKEEGFTGYTNLADGTTCRQPSGWAPCTTRLVEHFYKIMGGRLGRYVDAVYVTDCAEYGELGYPLGYTKWLRQDDNAKLGWWCGDPYARGDFRQQALEQYKTVKQINQSWGTSFASEDQIAYPPIGLLKNNKDPRQLTPQQRRWILDFVYWYQEASPRRVKMFMKIAQAAFPKAACEIKLGHGNESAVMGHSYTSACRILKGTPRLSIRSTHAAVSYFHVKRVATPARFYGFRFLTEPPGTIKPERMAERIFTDACCGVSAYFDYTQNPAAAGEAFSKNIGLLDGRPAIVDVALLFPEADHYLRIQPGYPGGLLEVANAVRDVADYDVVDERLIADGALRNYAILVIAGHPLIEESTWQALKQGLGGDHALHIIQIAPDKQGPVPGEFTGVDGQVRTLPAGQQPGTIELVRDQPGGATAILAVQRAYAAVLAGRGLDRDTTNLLTDQDGVWAALFEHRILVYNGTDQEQASTGVKLAKGQILEIKRER